MRHLFSFIFACALTLASYAQPSTQKLPAHPVQLVSAVRINPTTVEVNYANGHQLTFDFYGANIFRLFQDNSGGIIRNPEATPPANILVDNPRRCPGLISLSENDDAYTFSTSRMAVSIDRLTANISVTDIATGRCVLKQTAPLSYDNGAVQLSFACNDGEYFYGGGVQNGRFSHRGQQIAIENSNVWVDGGVASPTPFYWSTNGYGILWHTFSPGLYDFGATDASTVTLKHSGNYLDLFVMVDATPAKLLCDFYQLTGNPVLLPKFGFYQGHLNAYNRDYWTPAEEGKQGFMNYEDGRSYNESQKDNGGIRESLNGELVKDGKRNYQFSARAAIDRYLKNDMPLGWFLPNDGYGAGYGQTSSLDGNIANLKSFGDYARKNGVEIGLWTQSDLHPKEGIEPLLQRDIVKEVRDAGVRVLKTDVAWVGWGYSFGLNGVADVGQIMPYYGNDARPFIISLDGWAGTQRYAGIWTGDQVGGDWEYIRFHIPTFIGSGLSGQPNITSDVDGIFGGKNIPVNVREFQWKTYTPMELNMDGWGSNPKYPQVLGEPATSINRWYLKEKSMLLPYQYSIARTAVDGEPYIRAMFLDEANPYTLGTATQYQYMFGPSLLVAPIYQNTAADAQGNDILNGVYLPEGTWYNYWTSEAIAGGRIINNIDAPLTTLPVFAKAGAIIPRTPANNNPAGIRTDVRQYEIFPGPQSSFTEYDDDGRTQAYLHGQSATTLVEQQVKGDRLTLTVHKTEGDFSGMTRQKSTQFFIHAAAAPRKVVATVAGRKVPVTVSYDVSADLHFDTTTVPNLAKTINISVPTADITTGDLVLTISGYQAPTAAPLHGHGALVAPTLHFADADVKAYSITPSWKSVDGADYYEIEFEGQCYSTIRDTHLAFTALTPETPYSFRLRAVNADGASAWTEGHIHTIVDPYKWAVKGIKASTTCENQSGQGVDKLFDFDESTDWHSKWGKGEAIPFDLTVDLRSVNTLDRFEYMPRKDAGNGTLLRGTVSLSVDRQHWTTPVAFQWERNGDIKTFTLAGDTARYIRIHAEEGVGNFASGTELHVFRQEGTEGVLQGDINRDRRIDENDLTSYMNYTGLRRVDTDFDYVSVGDINGNGLIDAYDISIVSTELDGGVRYSSDKVSGHLTLTPSRTTWKAGDEVLVTVNGVDIHYCNGLSFGLPYSTDALTYEGLDLQGMKDMVNLTYDRLHSNGQKELLPTFVNRGNNFLLEEGSHPLFVIKFRAKTAGKWNLSPIDGILVDRNLNTISAF